MPSGNTYTGRLRPGKRPMAAGIARVSPCTAISREKLVKWPGGTYIFNNLIFRFQYTRSLRFLKHISDIDITRFKEVSNRFYHVFTMFLPCFYHLSTCSHPAFEALCRHALRHSPAQLCRERPVCGRVAAHGLRSDASLCPLGEKNDGLMGLMDGLMAWFPLGWMVFFWEMDDIGWMDGWWMMDLKVEWSGFQMPPFLLSFGGLSFCPAKVAPDDDLCRHGIGAERINCWTSNDWGDRNSNHSINGFPSPKTTF